MTQPTQKRPPPEYIEKLSALHKVWARENEEANKLVFADLDLLLAKAMKIAWMDEHFEAYAHLDKLRIQIQTSFAQGLKAELDMLRKLPE